MSLTLQQLVDQIQNVLSVTDPDTTWPETKIAEWARQGIRDYSRYFPRYLEVTLTTGVGTGWSAKHVFQLPGDFLEVVSVEYPVGEDPPVWNRRLDSRDEDFEGGAFYDVWPARDATGKALLVVGREQGSGESIKVTYLGLHNVDLGLADTVTVPDEDIELIIQFVKMRAFEERLANETLSADPTSNLVMWLGTNARAAKEEYERLVDKRRRLAGGFVRWGMRE